MLKNHKAFPQNRPLSRLEHNIFPTQLRTKSIGMAFKPRSQSQKNPQEKRKIATRSPTKQNMRPNLLRQKSSKQAAANENIILPPISNKQGNILRNRRNKNPVTDFETYCSKGHTVFVDERDAGVKLGQLKQEKQEHERKLSEGKQHIGETAYIPYTLELLKRKVDQKVNMTLSTCMDEDN